MAASKTGDDKKVAKSSPKETKKVTAKAPAEPAVTPAASTAPVSETSTAAPKRSFDLKQRWVQLTIGGVVAVIVLLLVVFGILIYKYKSDSPLVYDVASVIPYPAEKVNGSYVSYGQYLFELKSVKQYYQSQTTQSGQPGIDFNSADGKAKLATLRKQVLAQLTADTVTRQVIAKNKITVSSKEVNDQVDQIVKASGGLDKVKSVLTKFYGWSLNDLKDKVKFQLAKQKLQTKLSSDNSLNAQAKAKAADVLAQLKAGGDFATLAKKYSQDSSSANGGDMGFFSKGQVGDTTFDNTAFGLEAGATSDVIHTKFGYQIIKVTEFNADKTQVHASQILIEPIDFDNYLQDQASKAKVSQYLKV